MSNKIATRFVLSTAMVLVLSSCGIIGPNYHRPLVDTPDNWAMGGVGPNADEAQQKQQQEKLQAGWWKNYNDPVLESLIKEGMAANSDLEVAAARVSQAQAQADYASANRLPLIGIEGDASRGAASANSLTTGAAAAGGSKPVNAFSLAGTLDYELDLWGRLARASESARAELLSADYNKAAVELAVSSQIAASYFNLRALDAQVEITEQTIKAREDEYGIEKKQFDIGQSNGLTFRQAESELASTRAVLPQLRQQREEQLSALSVLLGRTPKQIAEGAIARGSDIDTLPVPPVAPPLVPGDLPSTLLERRPDIAAAEEQLASSTAEIAVARAEYFPRISLSALAGLSSIQAGKLFNSNAHTWSIGADAVGPLIDFGRTNADVDLAKGVRDEDLATYKQTIRTAFKDARDALAAQGNTAERQQAEGARVDALAEALRLSKLRYDAGYSSNLEVLDSQRGLYEAQLDRIDAKLQRLVASINLYKALGGGWQLPKED